MIYKKKRKEYVNQVSKDNIVFFIKLKFQYDIQGVPT